MITTNYEELRNAVNYASAYEPALLQQFCKQNGRNPLNHREAERDAVAIITQGGDEKIEEFFLGVHPDAEVYAKIMDNAMSNAAAHSIKPQIASPTRYFDAFKGEGYFSGKEMLIAVFSVSVIVFLISQKA